MAERQPNNPEQYGVAVVIHHPEASQQIPDPIHYTLEPGQVLLFLTTGESHLLTEREDGTYYPDDMIVDPQLIARYLNILFRFDRERQVIYWERPEKRTRVKNALPNHTIIHKGGERFDLFAASTFGKVMDSIQEYEQRSESFN